MATYIDFCSEQEQAIELAKYISKLNSNNNDNDTLVSEAQKLIEGKNMQELLKKFLEATPVIIRQGHDKDIENFFFAFLTLTKKQDHETARDLASKLVSTLISSSVEEKSLLRLKILSNMYNIFDQNPTLRFEIFIAMTKFAKATHHTDVIIPHFRDIEKRIVEWGITLKEKRDLYKSIRDAFRENKKSTEAHQWATKYLATFETDTSDPALTEEAVSAALEAIKLRDLYQFEDLLELAPIKLLATGSGNAPKLFALLKIFVGETIEAFNQFVAANPDLLKSYQLDASECAEKMRLLSLATLGAGAAANNSEVSYALIAKTLQVDESEVEMYVVTAISEGILAAKMDQIRRSIVVTYSIQRVFTNAQWKQLSDQLAVWTNNVNLLARTLGECKLTAASALANAHQQQQH